MDIIKNAILEENEKISEEDFTKRFIFKELELGSLASIKKFGEWFINDYNPPRVNLLYLNAGGWISCYQETEEGYEKNFGVNYLGHFYLLEFIFPKLVNTDNHRVIITASSLQKKLFVRKFEVGDLEAAMKRFGKAKSYGKSKLASVMLGLALKLHKEKRGYKGKYFSWNPGQTRTGIQDNLPELFFKVLFAIGNQIYMKTPFQAAQTAFQLGFEEIENLEDGAFYSNSKVRGINSLVKVEKSVETLWNNSIALLEQQEHVTLKNLPRFK